MWAGAGRGPSLGPEWVSVSGTGGRPSRVRLLNEEWTERPVCQGDRRPLGPSRAYPPAFPSSRTSAQTDRTALSPHLVPALSPPGAPFGDFLHGGPELFCSARGLAFPCCLWGLEEPARQQGPARASGPRPLHSVICKRFPSAAFCGAVLAPRSCVPVSPLPPGCRGPHEP